MSEPEHIILVGGPADRRQISWLGGDVVYISGKNMVMAGMPESSPPSETSTKVDKYAYRRSIRTKHLFVYQP